MARVNCDEFYGLFPENKFDIKVRSNDHYPPHFHVLSQGWNISFYIETGELYRYNEIGKDRHLASYIIKNIKEWLKSKSARYPDKTNHDVVLELWNEIPKHK